MRFFKRIVPVVLIFFALVSAFNNKAQAQAKSNLDIRIGSISTIETPDSMILKAYFNIYDPKTSLPVLENLAKGAQVSLPQFNFTTDAQIKKPDVPIYVVLVMDASGSMGGAAEDLKKAAKLALNNTPNDSYFSVVQFDESIKLIQDFTENISAISFAIDQYKVSNKGTCLYDAAYSSVEALHKAPPGRRAVIMFTDGKDETVQGKVCSKHTYQELVDLAMKDQVPINAIGLSYKEGNVNEVELNGMSSSTGGFSAIAKQDEMSKAFAKIMDVLKSQWMVETSIYPRRGANTVVMTLNLQDDQILTTSFPVTSNTDYSGPPSPVIAQFAGLKLNAARQSYEVQVNLTSPELVDYVKIAVWDKNAGAKSGEYVFKDPTANNTFLIPTEALSINRAYTLVITAVAKNGGIPFDIVRSEDGKLSKELSHDFTFDPSSAYPSLQIQSVTEKSGDLLLAIAITNPELISGFDGWLVDEETNMQAEDSSFKLPAMKSTTGALTIPLRTQHVPDGKYTVVLRVLAKNASVYSTTTYEGVTYKAPTLIERLGVALIAAPIILFAILALIIFIVIFLVFISTRQKNMSGTPVMQGQLGSKLGSGRAAGPVIPIADEEPIPLQGRTPPQVFPVPPQPPTARPTADATVIGNAPAGQAAYITIIPAPGSPMPVPIPVNANPFVIGRNEGNLAIPEPNISRRHAQITCNTTGKAYFLTDLGSSNGTYVNGNRLAPNQPFPLQNGAMIALGPNVSVRFELR